MRGKKGYGMPEDLVVDCFDIANGDIDKFISMLTMHGVTKGNAVDWYHLLKAALEKWNGKILSTTAAV